MQIKSLVLFLILNLFLFAQDAFAECIQIPTCAELGYTYTAKDCKGVRSLSCPFDANKLFCPEDCSSYKLEEGECDSNIGKCRQCARNGKWKYESCDGDGWMLSDGDCVPNSCSSTEGFRIEKLDAKIGTVETCTKGTTLTYRYSSCKDGWLHQIPSYNCTVNPCEGFETHSIVCPANNRCGESCPSFATCEEKCKSGEQTKAKIVCDDGYFMQNPDLTGEHYKCRKHKIGNIAFYCKDKGKISELANKLKEETGNTSYLKIDDNDDQIISLEPGYYDKARNYNCYAIGIVFYNDTTTKIVGLKNIGYSASEPYFTEQKTGSNVTTSWSSCASDIDECNVSNLIDTTTEGNQHLNTDTEGSENTSKIIAWRDSKKDSNNNLKYTVAAAQATRAYYPRYCIYNTGTSKLECSDICPYVNEDHHESSACSNDRWYLPSIAEWNILFNKRYKSPGKLYLKAMDKILEEQDVGFDLTKSGGYWSSTEAGRARARWLPLGDGNNTITEKKDYYLYVRPVLVIE